MKLILWDLETAGYNFKGDKGFILCGGIKELGKPAYVLVRDNIKQDPLNDKKLCKQLYNVLSQADMWVTHNGKWFDVRFLNTRLIHWGLPSLPNVPHFDTCELAFKRLAVKASLESLGKFLGCHVSKYTVDMNQWFRAQAGNPDALKEIVHHCKNDVKLTEEVYKKLRPMSFKHPNTAAIQNDNRRCPICGKKDTLQRRGWQVGQVNRAYRYQCTGKNGCGAWSHGGYKKTGVDVRP